MLDFANERVFTIDNHPQEVSGEGWHKIEVKIEGRNTDEVRFRTGYEFSPAQQ